MNAIPCHNGWHDEQFRKKCHAHNQRSCPTMTIAKTKATFSPTRVCVSCVPGWGANGNSLPRPKSAKVSNPRNRVFAVYNCCKCTYPTQFGVLQFCNFSVLQIRNSENYASTPKLRIRNLARKLMKVRERRRATDCGSQIAGRTPVNIRERPCTPMRVNVLLFWCSSGAHLARVCCSPGARLARSSGMLGWHARPEFSAAARLRRRMLLLGCCAAVALSLFVCCSRVALLWLVCCSCVVLVLLGCCSVAVLLLLCCRVVAARLLLCWCCAVACLLRVVALVASLLFGCCVVAV